MKPGRRRPMAEVIPYGRKTQRDSNVKELDILWITGGLSCDGDSVSVTAAQLPSVEDVVLGAVPGLPKGRLHNAVLAYTNGADFLEPFHRAARGELDPFVLVVEGSIPNEEIHAAGGHW